MESLGIIGVGQLARYFVAGLRKAGDNRQIFLAPRNKEMSAQIASDYDCIPLSSNQGIADKADIILLATRPEHALIALQETSFREGQILLSVVAGVALNDLQNYCSPAKAVRCLPLAPAEVCAGATPLFPDEPRSNQLLSSIATVVPVENEDQFELGSVAGCIGGWAYQIIAELQAWLEKTGLNEMQARDIAIETFHGATSLAREFPEMNLQQQADSIGSEGTYTRFFIDDFKERGGVEAFHKTSDALYKKLK